MRILHTLAVAALAIAASIPLANAESRTIRIEPRPYTSAVVTVESGVRVWRPMPPTGLVIVNPGNKANITLNVDGDSRRQGDVINNNVNANQYFRGRNY